MSKLEPDVVYTVGVLSDEASRNPAFPEFKRNKSDSKPGKYFLDKGITTIEEILSKNPLGLELGHTYHIYRTDGNAQLHYLYHTTLEKEKDKPAKTRPRPRPTTSDGLNDSMTVYVREQIEQLQERLEIITRERDAAVGERDTLRSQIFDRDRQILALESELKIIEERNNAKLEVQQARHDAALQNLNEKFERERELMAEEANVAARQYADEQKQSSLSGFVDRWEPKVGPIFERLLDMGMRKFDEKFSSSSPQPPQAPQHQPWNHQPQQQQPPQQPPMQFAPTES